MNRKIFLIIGVVGLGLIVNGFVPTRADAPVRNESNARAVHMSAAVAETLTQGTAGGQVGEIAMHAAAHEAPYKIDMAVNTPILRGSKINTSSSLLKQHHTNTAMTVAQFSARVEATIQHGIDNGGTSGIGETFLIEINTVVRWMSLIALSIFIFVVYKACCGPATKHANM